MRRAAAVSRVFLVAATVALTFAIASAAQSPGYAAGFRLATVAAVDRPARDEILMQPGHAARDPAGIERAGFHRRLNRETTACFDTALT